LSCEAANTLDRKLLPAELRRSLVGDRLRLRELSLLPLLPTLNLGTGSAAADEGDGARCDFDDCDARRRGLPPGPRDPPGPLGPEAERAGMVIGLRTSPALDWEVEPGTGEGSRLVGLVGASESGAEAGAG